MKTTQFPHSARRKGQNLRADASTALAQAAQVATDVPNSMAEYVNMSDSCDKTTCSFEKNCLSSCQMTCAKRLGVQTYVHAFPANGT